MILFFINLIVDVFLLPLWGLDGTDRNDIYFKIWWIVVECWLIFGTTLLKYWAKKPTKNVERLFDQLSKVEKPGWHLDLRSALEKNMSDTDEGYLPN